MTTLSPLFAGPKRSGYSRKPFWIALFSLGMFLWPVFEFVTALRDAQVVGWYNPVTAWSYLQTLPAVTLSLMGSFMISSLLLLMVRRETLFFSVAVLGAIILYNRISHDEWTLGPMLTLGLMFLTPFKRPFLDASSRWWERAPRYFVKMKAYEIDLKRDFDLVNISVSGALLEDPKQSLRLGEYLVFSFEDLLSVRAEVVRADQGRVATRFINLSAQQATLLQKIFRKFIIATPLPEPTAKVLPFSRPQPPMPSETTETKEAA